MFFINGPLYNGFQETTKYGCIQNTQNMLQMCLYNPCSKKLPFRSSAVHYP